MPSSPEFSVPVSSLDAGGKTFEFPIRPSWLRGALEGCDVGPTETEGHLEVRLSMSGRDVVASGSLDAELEMPCARCLGPATVKIDHTFSVLYVPGETESKKPAKRGAKDEEDEEIVASDEADTQPYDGDTVVLDEFIRDELLLETPMIPLCSDACPGMSASPGDEAEEKSSSEPAIDPRLLPLMRWKTPKKS